LETLGMAATLLCGTWLSYFCHCFNNPLGTYS